MQDKNPNFGIHCIDANYVRPGIACFYLIEHGGECAIVETGTSRSFPALPRFMQQHALQPQQVRYVIPTHVHLDHAGGAGTMMAAFTEAQLLIHPRGARHMANPSRLVASSQQVYGPERFRELYGDVVPVAPERIREMTDGESVSLGGRALQFRHTAGHANHHFCIWDETSRGWFTGDAFGISYPWFRFDRGDCVIPATTPTQFNPEAFKHSLELLDSYHPERMFLTHYGELAYSPDKLNALWAQVADYPVLAERHGGEHAPLKKALIDYSLQQLRQHAPAELPEEILREQVAMDADLNAQGLVTWYQQREH